MICTNFEMLKFPTHAIFERFLLFLLINFPESCKNSHRPTYVIIQFLLFKVVMLPESFPLQFQMLGIIICVQLSAISYLKITPVFLHRTYQSSTPPFAYPYSKGLVMTLIQRFKQAFVAIFTAIPGFLCRLLETAFMR